jgi:epsilon-lactone hydrolase
MPSLRSRLLIAIVKHRHWFHHEWKQSKVDMHTSIPQLRERVEKIARVFGRLPSGVTVSPVSMNGLSGEWIRPRNVSSRSAILYFHGGGYVMGSCRAYRSIVAKFSARCRIPALSFDYRLAPEYPFPAALDDAIVAYHWLRSQEPAPARVIFVGDSGGGGLCLAALLAIRDRGLPLPDAAVALSPWTDLRCTGESHQRKDPVAPEGCFPVFAKHYAGTHDPGDPLISPLYGELAGLPPLLITVGECEQLLDDSVRFAAKARNCGVDVNLIVGRGMVHTYPFLAPFSPEAQEAMDDICAFIARHG